MHKEDIGDDEIRIVGNSSSNKTPSTGRPNRQQPPHRRAYMATVICCLLAVVIIICIKSCGSARPAGTDGGKTLDVVMVDTEPAAEPADNQHADTEPTDKQPADSLPPAPAQAAAAFTTVTDTVVNRQPLIILTPRNATPTLCLGDSVLGDSSAILATQAADIRSDNGGIVGAFVLKGQLLSSGKSKSGFCAIIGGKPIIGVADATPYLEQAIDTEGYFFRQYPLVVAGQLVENKPKNSSLRKAIGELNGEVIVVLSRNRMTINDFARALVDLGMSNAIYLVGSDAYGFAVDAEGNRLEFGKPAATPPANVNYIVWQ